MDQILIEHLERDPFIPFRIVLTSGEGFDVHNPHLIAVGKSVIHYLYPRSDRSAVLRMNQIASFQTLEPAA